MTDGQAEAMQSFHPATLLLSSGPVWRDWGIP